MNKIPVSVRRGEALLDERLPGWRDEIDVEKLDLSSTCDCVLGELFGDYDRGVKMLGLDPAEQRWYGFMDGRTSFDKLTAAWRRVIG